MTQVYSDSIERAARVIADSLVAHQSNLEAQIETLDGVVREVLRAVGKNVMATLLRTVGDNVIGRWRESGFTMDQRHTIGVGTIFGYVEMSSPRMRRRSTGDSARPVTHDLKLRDRSRTTTLERALCDFGVEESFEIAEERFREHYGWDIGRTTILRLVHQHGEAALKYVDERLADERKAYDEPLATRPGRDEMLAELDGCEIRTGKLEKTASRERSPVRGLPKRKRTTEWKEVRVGLTRGLDEASRSYVAAITDYQTICEQLFSAAVGRGLSTRTDVVLVSDGANGLREALESVFAGATYVLDRPHLVQHLYETADEMGFTDTAKRDWVHEAMDRIAGGRLDLVLDELLDAEDGGCDRARRLIGYIDRFEDAIDYTTAKERGWPIGSGEVESAHRYIPQKRLKIPGATWRPETVNKVLGLRVVRANKWWDEYWNQQADAKQAA